MNNTEISYEPLWNLLKEKNMMKKDLQASANLTLML